MVTTVLLSGIAEAVSFIFLSLVKSLLAPLLFGLIVSSLARPRERFGRDAWLAILYFELVSGVAMFLGWAAIAYFEPGNALPLPRDSGAPPKHLGLADLLVRCVPESGIAAMAANDMLPMLCFFALLGLSARRQPRLADFAESVYAVAQRYAKYVMYLAIPGMIAAIAFGILSGGWSLVQGMGRFVAAAWAAQLATGILLFGGIAVASGVPVPRLLRCAGPALLLAVTTTSSAAALPKAIEGMERYGVPRGFLGFVMPLGLSFNLCGSAVQLTMAVLFTAQAAGRPLDFGFVFSVWLILKVAVKGVAGLPRANMVILAAVLPVFGLPLSVLPLLLAVDALIDIVRTPVNVLGNCLAPAVLRTVHNRISSPQCESFSSPAR
jgi:proton glutamate symport protein